MRYLKRTCYSILIIFAIVFWCFVFWFVFDKSSLEQNYGYERISRKTSVYKVLITLDGTGKKRQKPHGFVRGAPYNLYVSIDPNPSNPNNQKAVKTGGCFTEIHSLELINLTNKAVLFSKSNLKRQAWQFFSFRDLDLPYDDYRIELEFSFSGTCEEVRRQKIQATMKKKFEEEWFSFWDVLGGV